ATGPPPRRRKLGLAYGLLALVTVAVIVVIWLLHFPQPACVVLFGASYDVNLALPHNAYGWKGLQHLADVAQRQGSPDWRFWDGDAGKLRVEQPCQILKSYTGWEERWKDVIQRAI